MCLNLIYPETYLRQETTQDPVTWGRYSSHCQRSALVILPGLLLDPSLPFDHLRWECPSRVSWNSCSLGFSTSRTHFWKNPPVHRLDGTSHFAIWLLSACPQLTGQEWTSDLIRACKCTWSFKLSPEVSVGRCESKIGWKCGFEILLGAMQWKAWI